MFLNVDTVRRGVLAISSEGFDVAAFRNFTSPFASTWLIHLYLNSRERHCAWTSAFINENMQREIEICSQLRAIGIQLGSHKFIATPERTTIIVINAQRLTSSTWVPMNPSFFPRSFADDSLEFATGIRRSRGNREVSESSSRSDAI